MWLCGAIGSKDATYSKQCLNATLIDEVAGTSVCFGDITLSDEYYYYNQSLGMLGFAAFTGMFPNVLADTIKAYVKTEDFRKKSRGFVVPRPCPAGGSGFRLGKITRPVNILPWPCTISREKGAFAISGNRLFVFMPVAKDRLCAGIYILKVRCREPPGKRRNILTGLIGNK